MLTELLVEIKLLRSRQRLGLGDGRAKPLPRDHRRDGAEGIEVVLAGGDQRSADARIKTDFLVDGPGVGLEGAGMPTLGLAKHGADQAVKQVDRLVSQTGADVQADGDERRMPALPLVTGDMLHGGAASLASKPGKARLMDQVSTARLDADRANMLQALDQTEHGARLGGLRHLPQPGQPVLVCLFPALCQRIELASLLGGETIGQPAIHLPTGLVAEFGAEPLDRGRRRNDDPALPACLHHLLGQMGEPIILNGLRQKGACQFGRGTFAERTKPELLLAFDCMTLAVPLRREILVHRVRKNPDLLGDECEQGRRRSLAGAQRSAGVAQVTEHESVAEAVVISAAAQDCYEIGFR